MADNKLPEVGAFVYAETCSGTIEAVDSAAKTATLISQMGKRFVVNYETWLPVATTATETKPRKGSE